MSYSNIFHSHELFAGIDDKEISLILSYTKKKSYKAGSIIVDEGEKSNELFLLLKGQARITKTDSNLPNEFTIREVGPNALFGEFAFIDENRPRTARVEAVVDVEVFVLEQTALHKLKEEHPKLANQLLANATKLTIDHLSETTKAYVKSSAKAFQELALRNQFGKLFIVIMSAMVVSDFMTVLAQGYGVDRTSNFFTWTYVLFILLPILLLMKKFNYSFADFGVTLKNWKRVIAEAIGISLVIGIVYILTVIFIRKLAGIPQEFSFRFLQPDILLYFPHSYIQEFIARGVMLGLLTRFFSNSSTFLAVLISSLLFAQFHLFVDWQFGVLTFFSGILFSYIYLYQRNLLGVSLVHALLGIVTIYLKLM